MNFWMQEQALNI